ncbi:MAG: penicillin acylase family protein [Candidatus Dormibacteria bacterium]
MVVAMAVLGAVVALLAMAAVALVVWMRRPLPRTRGRLLVDGTDAAVRVVRDRFGTAHVDAASMTDAAYAMGLVHAQERLWQLDFTRRVASGRISEIAGPQGLGADRLLRRVGLRRAAEAEAATLSGDVLAMLTAYAAGVNAVIGGGRRLPIEFRLLRLRPEPWAVVDSVACAKLLAFGLSLNWEAELQRLQLLRAIGPERAARLDIAYPEANPTILADTVRSAGTANGDALALYREAARWMPVPEGASNAWALSGERTASGRPLLCNDPHLQPTVPSVWFAAHVRVAGDFESTGVTLAGQPFPVIGHNQRIAWGYTNSMVDAQDLVVEQFDTVAGGMYRTEAGWRESEVVRERIRVRDSDDEVEEVLVTRHGPIVERCDDHASGRCLGLALQWTALQTGGASATVLGLQRARDWEGFRAALHSLDAPSQNGVYADVDGHIGYFCSGRIPVRRRPAAGLPQPGWNGDAIWDGFLGIDDVPQQLDPPSGQVVTANNRVVGSGFPHYVGADFLAGYRALRIEELLGGDATDAAAMRRLQMDTVSPAARQVARLLGGVTCSDAAAEQWRRRLAAWDGDMRADRQEPTVYTAFVARLYEHALRPVAGDAWGIAAGTALTHPVFGIPPNLLGRMTPTLLERWEAGDESLFEGTTTWAEVAAHALADAVADVRRRGRGRSWGRVHAVRLEHPLAITRWLRPLLNAPAISVGGDPDSVMATGARPGPDMSTRVMAPSWRQVLDVGAWEASTGIHYPGQSGHRASRHHHDLSRRWRRNRQLPLAWGDAAFRGRRTLHLVPRERGMVTR